MVEIIKMMDSENSDGEEWWSKERKKKIQVSFLAFINTQYGNGDLMIEVFSLFEMIKLEN